MKIGYARVSTKDQNLALQIEALEKYGCEKIIQEKASTRESRKKLDDLLAQLNAKDILVVWKLDRLGRTTIELIKIIDHLNKNNIKFKSLNDDFIDTTTPNGKLVFSIFAALAEHEREIIRERTRAGLEAARARGKLGGRPKGLSDKAKMKAAAAVTLYNRGELISKILSTLSIGSKATLYRYLKYEGITFKLDKT